MTIFLRGSFNLVQPRIPLKRSSRAQARTTLGREFPIFTLSIAKRVPSPALAHVSCALSKIPYVGFSPIRLQAEAPYDHPYPSRQPYKIKRHVRILPHGSRFDRAFVVLMPSCLNGGHYQHHQPQAGWTTTSAHGSFARKGLCCPFPHRSYDPIRQSRRLPPISHCWLYGGSLPDDLVWAAPETFPAFRQHSFPTCRHPYAGRRAGEHMSSLSPAPVAFPIVELGRLLHLSRHRFRSGNLNDAAMFALCCGPQSC